MFMIKKVRADCTVDFAAEELKKYLRMMMPRAGEIPIAYAPDAADGFRLGLFEDFDIPFEGKDTTLDDVVHIETDEKGGVLAGSNPRSVLFAVYRFLKINGCRFLFPGTDGEFVPRKAVEPVSYHHMASYSYRGHTTEGAPSLEDVLRYIDYHAKQELNVYGLYEIFPYHNSYYNHRNNPENRLPEPVDRDTVEQWEALCQAELVKRGMQIWGGGHGWTDRTAGFDMNDRYLYMEGKKELPEEIRQNLAMINGVRGMKNNNPSFTNLCMSRADLRTRYADLFVEYLAEHPQLSAASASLADTSRNHCECPECQKKRPSDFYMMLLNEIDEKLTARGIQTKLHVSAYVDCMFPPEVERLKNPARFLVKATPIDRQYTSSLTKDSVYPPMQPYVRNHWKTPATPEAYFSYFRAWQALFPECDSLIYDYHYWWPQYKEMGSVRMSRRVYEDVLSWKLLNASGVIEDGSNKSFWPNGFIDHIYGATLWDDTLDYDAELADYYSHIYGTDWKKAYAYLKKISDAFDHSYMSGEKSADPSRGKFYNPAQVEKLSQVKEYAAEIREIIAAHMTMPTRPQTVCWRLLLRHAEYVQGVAEIITELCQGHYKYAMELFEKFRIDFGKYSYETERYFDYAPAMTSLRRLLTPPKKAVPAVADANI